MHPRDVQIGHTYAVLVPARLPAGRYPDRDRLGTSTWMIDFLACVRYRLTVTGIDDAAGPAAVDGLRMMIQPGYVAIDLTGDQVTAAGLVPDRRYRLVGSLCDSAGRAVFLPDLEPVRVPAWWLHATGNGV
ncbi:hypothetical protein [Nocardia spumae]|uniref:hypothetical protein n=1 Tax=Nocardia spumae TaxID=2887190 RepID=UPI001D1420AA|nr:hypothetical protein [Nocardia spumae]